MPPAGTFGSATTQPIRRIVDRVTLRNTGRSTAAAELGELDRGECLRLLGKSTVGRVVFTEGALPAAHPVTYLLDDEEVIFRTAAGSKLAAAARHQIVGFQADAADPHLRRPGGSTIWAVSLTGPRRPRLLSSSPLIPACSNAAATR